MRHVRPASRLRAAALALALALPLPATAQGWAKTGGGPLWDFGMAVTAMPSGGSVVAARSAEHGAWVSRLDDAGAVAWQTSVDSIDLTEGGFLHPTTDGGVFLAATFRPSVGDLMPCVVELDASGTLVQQRLFRVGGSARLTAFAATNDGLVLAGTVSGLPSWIVWLDPGLAVVRGKGLRTSGGSFAPDDLWIAPDGGVVLAGLAGAVVGTVLRLDPMGNAIDQVTLDFGPCSPTALQIAGRADGTFVVGGTQSCLGDESTSAVVARLDANLNPTLVVGFLPPAGAGATQLRDLAIVGGGACVVGASQFGGPAFAARLDAALNVEWLNAFGERSGGFEALAPMPDGGFVCAGFLSPRGSEHADVLAVRVDSLGNTGTTCGQESVPPLSASRRGASATSAALTVMRVDPLGLAGTIAAVPMSELLRDLGDVGERDSCDFPVTLFAGAPLARDFCGDSEDWFEIDACSGASYTILTSGLGPLADTVIDVLSWDCSAALATDDDGGGGAASRLDWTAPVDGRFRVRVSQRDATSGPDRGYVVSFLRNGPGCATWMRTYEAMPPVLPSDAAVLDDGSVVVVGTPDDWLPAPTGVDPVVLRVDDGGELLGAARLLGADDEAVVVVERLPAGGYLVGGNSNLAGRGAAFLRAVDAAGGVAWERLYQRDSGDTVLTSARALSDGGVLLAGIVVGFETTAWLVRLDASGVASWERELSAAPAHWDLRDVAEAADGSLLVVSQLGASSAVTTLDAGGAVTAHRVYDLPFLARMDVAPGGGLLVASDEAIARLRSDGSAEWCRVFGRPATSFPRFRALAATSDGGCLVGGSVSSPAGVDPPPSLMKVDASGATNETYGLEQAVSGNGDFRAIAHVPGGGFVVVGDVASEDALAQFPIMVVRLDANGELRDSCLRRGAPMDSTPRSVVVVDAIATIVSGSSTTAPSSFVPNSIPVTPRSLCAGAGSPPPTEVSPPGSPSPLVFDGHDTLRWETGWPSGSERFNVYRGTVSGLHAGEYGYCLVPNVEVSWTTDRLLPGIGSIYTYLVAGENAGGHGTLGHASDGAERVIAATCP